MSGRIASSPEMILRTEVLCVSQDICHQIKNPQHWKWYNKNYDCPEKQH